MAFIEPYDITLDNGGTRHFANAYVKLVKAAVVATDTDRLSPLEGSPHVKSERFSQWEGEGVCVVYADEMAYKHGAVPVDVVIFPFKLDSDSDDNATNLKQQAYKGYCELKGENEQRRPVSEAL